MSWTDEIKESNNALDTVLIKHTYKWPTTDLFGIQQSVFDFFDSQKTRESSTG